MLRIERGGKRLVSLSSLERKAMPPAYDLADFVVNSPGALFDEIGETALALGAGLESGGSDLLAVDPAGALLIVAVQKRDEASALPRAMNSAARVASWSPEDLLLRVSAAVARRIKGFLGAKYADLNRTQRMLLLADSFGEQTLVAADWLRGHGLDIRTMEAAMLADSDIATDYLELKTVSGPDPSDAPGPSPMSGLEPRMNAPGKASAAGDAERRTAARSGELHSARVRIEYAGRGMGARLVDFSEGGIGIEMHNPLPIGSKVVVDAELEDGAETTRLTGRGRIAFCKFGDKTIFRTGVCFEDSQRAIETTA